MKIKQFNSIKKPTYGFLKERFPGHTAQISTDTTLKLRSSVKDVARVKLGEVPWEIEELTKKFVTPPHGVTDRDHVFGYDTPEGHVPGAIDYDAALREYIKRYPEMWDTVKRVLSLRRGSGRHACLLGGEELLILEEGTIVKKPIEKCLKVYLPTGQGNFASAYVVASGRKHVKKYVLSNGKNIFATKDHKVLTISGWKTIEEAFLFNLELKEPICPK